MLSSVGVLGVRVDDVTVTNVEHVAVTPEASFALHDICVVPTENIDPDAGVHVVEIGLVPPVAIGLG